jgi:hypothetical protein
MRRVRARGAGACAKPMRHKKGCKFTAFLGVKTV